MKATHTKSESDYSLFLERKTSYYDQAVRNLAAIENEVEQDLIAV